MSKEELIWKYSNPLEVRKQVDKIYGNDVDLYLSTRASKKYMIPNPQTGKMIHFGQWGSEDATHHKNKDRITMFRIRNAKWRLADQWSPAYASYFLLWSL
jgi:hypothetical protein